MAVHTQIEPMSTAASMTSLSPRGQEAQRLSEESHPYSRWYWYMSQSDCTVGAGHPVIHSNHPSLSALTNLPHSKAVVASGLAQLDVATGERRKPGRWFEYLVRRRSTRHADQFISGSKLQPRIRTPVSRRLFNIAWPHNPTLTRPSWYRRSRRTGRWTSSAGAPPGCTAAAAPWP